MIDQSVEDRTENSVLNGIYLFKSYPPKIRKCDRRESRKNIRAKVRKKDRKILSSGYTWLSHVDEGTCTKPVQSQNS